VIDTIAESLGYAFNSKKELREFAARTLGEELGGFVTHGASALPGVPLDVQARLGIGNLIPGTGLLKRSNEDKSREVLEVFGAAGSQASRSRKPSARPRRATAGRSCAPASLWRSRTP
jgi:hypothetical protein